MKRENGPRVFLSTAAIPSMFALLFFP